MIFVLFLITNIYTQGVIFMKETQKSIVLASKVSGFDAGIMYDCESGINEHRSYHEVSAYNPQWGQFTMGPDNTKSAWDIRFADAKRGDLLLCTRIEDGNDVSYVVDEYLTLQKIAKEFTESQKQK